MDEIDSHPGIVLPRKKEAAVAKTLPMLPPPPPTADTRPHTNGSNIQVLTTKCSSIIAGCQIGCCKGMGKPGFVKEESRRR